MKKIDELYFKDGTLYSNIYRVTYVRFNNLTDVPAQTVHCNIVYKIDSKMQKFNTVYI